MYVNTYKALRKDTFKAIKNVVLLFLLIVSIYSYTRPGNLGVRCLYWSILYTKKSL